MTPTGTSTQIYQKHNQCIFQNLNLSFRNFNIWQSVVYLFTFLVKAVDFVPVLYQMIKQIESNDVVSVLLAIDEFYIVIPDPELYSPGLSDARNHVDVYLSHTNPSANRLSQHLGLRTN